MTAKPEFDRCILTYTNGRNVDHILPVDRVTAETILGMIEQPRSARIEDGMRLRELVEYLKLSNRLGNLGLLVGVQLRNQKTGLIERVKNPLSIRDVLFLAKCLVDERDSAFEIMASGLKRFILDGSVRVLHAFRESEVPAKLVL